MMFTCRIRLGRREPRPGSRLRQRMLNHIFGTKLKSAYSDVRPGVGIGGGHWRALSRIGEEDPTEGRMRHKPDDHAARSALSAAGELFARIERRLRQHGLVAHLLGLVARRRFTKAGIIVVRGWPAPTVENRGGRIEVENCAFLGGVRLECGRGAMIRIGNGTYLNRGAEIVAARSVTIGRDCKIARDVIVMDTDQHPIRGTELEAYPVRIGDRVWIGARAVVLKGVSLGNDCVVGAGAVVTKDVPAHAVVAGNPARQIYSLDAGGQATSA